MNLNEKGRFLQILGDSNLLLSDNKESNKEETHSERYCNSMKPWGCGQRALRVYKQHGRARFMNQPAGRRLEYARIGEDGCFNFEMDLGHLTLINHRVWC